MVRNNGGVAAEAMTLRTLYPPCDSLPSCKSPSMSHATTLRPTFPIQLRSRAHDSPVRKIRKRSNGVYSCGGHSVHDLHKIIKGKK